MVTSGKRFLCRLTVLIPVLAFLATGGCAKSDQKGPVVIERWPGEGAPVIAWTGLADSLPLYSQPGAEKPKKYLAVKQDQRLPWDRSLMLIKKMGQMEITEHCTMEACVYHAVDDHKLTAGKAATFTFSPGTILEVACYAAEGDYIFHYENRFMEMNGSRACQRMLIPPQTQWWVRLRRSNKVLGWIIVDGEMIAVVDRKS